MGATLRAVVHTEVKDKLVRIRHIDPSVTHVHIVGCPFLWAIRLLVRTLPRLRTISVIPLYGKKVSGTSYHSLCQASGVEIVIGHVRPWLAWSDDGRIVSPFYTAHRNFFLGLNGEQQQLFEELLRFNFEAAIITSRYFCLQGGEYASQRRLAGEYGLSTNVSVSVRVNAVILYLAPAFQTGKQARVMAHAMHQRVIRLRSLFDDVDQQKQRLAMLQRRAEELGVDRIPVAMPMARLDVFEALIVARQGENWRTLASRDRQIVSQRFGLDDGVYRTLDTVGREHGVTRQRIRQIEEGVLKQLGIPTD